MLRGLLGGAAGARLVTTSAEHPSIEEPAAALEAAGTAVARVPVDGDGRLDLAAFAEALAQPAALASVLLANNETGVLQDVATLAAHCAARGVPLHVDATQAVGKWPGGRARASGPTCSRPRRTSWAGRRASASWCGGAGSTLEPWLLGGGQERGRRGGTENVPGIVGLGVACELAAGELAARVREWGRLRDRLWEGIREKIPRVRRNGSARHVLPNTLSVEFSGADGEALLQALDLEGVAVSAGAACHSGSVTPSRVLRAMGRTRRRGARLAAALGRPRHRRRRDRARAGAAPRPRGPRPRGPRMRRRGVLA